MKVIYKICPEAMWRAAERAGEFVGAPLDLQDGFIHFSTAEQLPESAQKHRRGQSGLVLLTVDAHALGAALRWEPSRGGSCFPHLYGTLPVSAVRSVCEAPLDSHGLPVLPTL